MWEETDQLLTTLSLSLWSSPSFTRTHTHSLGEPVELSSKFIRYSTFKSGKEQLVSKEH